MKKATFEQIIISGNSVEANKNQKEFHNGLNSFAVAVGFGNNWEVDFDGVRYSVKKIDGDFRIKAAKVTQQVDLQNESDEPIQADAKICGECEEYTDNHDITCALRIEVLPSSSTCVLCGSSLASQEEVENSMCRTCLYA